MIEIREGGEADIPAFVEIRTAVRENHLSVEQMAERGITPASIAERLRGQLRAWMALKDGRPIGFSMADQGTGEVFALFVLPREEGQGAGRRLLAEATRHLSERGLAEARLGTGPGTRADSFYAWLGWTSDRVVVDGNITYRLKL